MASVSYELYYLVDKMSRTEKAYFKKFGFKYQKAENKSEFILFDLINLDLKNKSVDLMFEKTIERKFSKKIKGKYFITVKNSLFQSIVKTLISYDTATDRSNQSLMQCMEAKALLKRNLIKPALKIINKSKEVIQEQEDYILQLLLSEVELKLGIISNDKNIIEKAQLNERKNIDLIQANHDIKILYEKIYDIHRTHGVDIDGSLAVLLKPYIAQYIKLYTKGSTSLRFQYNYYSIGKLIGYILIDKDEIIKNLLGISQLIETRAYFFKGKNSFVLATYADLICHGLELGEVKYYNDYLQKFQNVAADTLQLESYKRSLNFKINLNYALLKKIYPIFIDLENEFLEVKEDLSFNNLMAIYEDFIFAFFQLKQYKKAIHFIYAQIDLCNKKQERFDFRLSSELLLLVINYELGDFDVIQNLVRSFENRMSNTTGFGKNEKNIFLFFKALKTKNFGDRKKIALNTFNELQANNYQSLALRFNFANWFLQISK